MDVPRRLSSCWNTYQARAGDAGRRPPGTLHGAACLCQMQVVGSAVEATGGFDDAASRRTHEAGPFTTVMGAIRFGVNGEWQSHGVLQIQFQEYPT